MEPLTLLRMIRLHIVAGGALAFSLGTLLAVAEGGTLEPLPVTLGYLVVLLGDLSTHYSNDYYDVETDKQSKTKKFFSGKKLLVTHPQLQSTAKTISLSLFTFSNILAAVVVLFFGAPTEFFVIALAANLLGWLYSAPPTRLGSRGLGETAVAFATGFAIPGIGYISVKGQLDPLFVYFSVPFMLYGFLLSLNLESPDITNDKTCGKHTLAVRLGERNVFFTVLAAVFLATSTFFVLTHELTSSFIDLNVVFLFSLIPLTAAILGTVISFKKRNMYVFNAINISSLFLFIIAMVTYLATLVF